jgi:hypothetical protein
MITEKTVKEIERLGRTLPFAGADARSLYNSVAGEGLSSSSLLDVSHLLSCIYN